MLLSFTEFVGHFHPLLVHLPIGILLLALLLQCLGYKEKYHFLNPAIKIVYLCGIVTAVLSCITGYMLSLTDEYDESTVQWHFWLALCTLLASLLLYLKELQINLPLSKKLLGAVLFILIALTGHLGGSLTHGANYITQPLKNIFSNDSTAKLTITPLVNVQEALLYEEVIKPILKTKCMACHNADKQKGGLRMDEITYLLKGGKGGNILKPGNAEESEMIKRIMLPVDNDKHMPPKEKPQPSESQMALMHWWINTGADFNKKIKTISQPDNIKPILLALQQPDSKQPRAADDFPLAPVEKANEKILQQLRLLDIIVLPIAQQSNYLSANFVTHTAIEKSDLKLLSTISKQLVWLKLDNTNLDDSTAAQLSAFTSLYRLTIANTNITDNALVHLNALTLLRYLNVSGTATTAKGFSKLTALKKLENMYVYNTNIKREDYAGIKNLFPLTTIDTGGYVVGLLSTDTTKLKGQVK